jgi:hypothetical protein
VASAWEYSYFQATDSDRSVLKSFLVMGMQLALALVWGLLKELVEIEADKKYSE